MLVFLTLAIVPDPLNAGLCSWSASRLQLKGYEFTLDSPELQKAFSARFRRFWQLQKQVVRFNYFPKDLLAIEVLLSAPIKQVQTSKHIYWQFLRRLYLPETSSIVSSKNLRLEIKSKYECAIACVESELYFEKSFLEKESMEELDGIAIYLPGIEGPVAIKKGFRYGSQGENTILALQNVVDPFTGNLVLIKGGIYQNSRFHPNYDQKILRGSKTPFPRIEIKEDEVFIFTPVRMFQPNLLKRFKGKSEDSFSGQTVNKAWDNFHEFLDFKIQKLKGYKIENGTKD